MIESLMYGVPVIGSRGASIDELVEPGVCGDLVAIGDAEALAEAMLRAWRGESRWVAAPAGLVTMQPPTAASRLLSLAGYRDGNVVGSPAERRTAPCTSRLALLAVHPSSARVGEGFNVQPDGQSALSIDCEGAGAWTTVVMDGVELFTTYGGPRWVTALVPRHLLDRSGSRSIVLSDQYLGSSNPFDFPVHEHSG
jgi:hypothetical protein